MRLTRALRTMRWSGIGALLAGVLLAGCGENATSPPVPTPTPTPAPTPDPTTQVVPIQGTGPVQIQFVESNIAPGSTVSGCGSLIEGCRGRLRMVFNLVPRSTGHALYFRVYIHATNQIACLWGETSSFDLPAGVATRIEVSFDNADQCGTPVSLVTMDGVVEGTVEVASRQEWALRYVFAP